MKQSSFPPCLLEKYYSHLIFQCKYTSWQLHNIGVTRSFGWFELRRWWEAAFSLSETAVKYAARIRSSLSRAISLNLRTNFSRQIARGNIKIESFDDFFPRHRSSPNMSQSKKTSTHQRSNSTQSSQNANDIDQLRRLLPGINSTKSKVCSM